MSTKAVIIALVIALLLGIGAYVALQPAAKPVEKASVFATGEQVFKMTPGSVSLIEIELPGGELQTVRRDEASPGAGLGGYSLTVSRQGVSGSTWPLEEGRVANILRVMNTSLSLDAPDDKTEMDEDAMRITIREDGGAVTHMLFGGRSLAGKGLVKVVAGASGDHVTLSELRSRPGKLALINDTIHNAFRQPGPRGWRDGIALRSVGPEVSRLHLVSADLSMRLSRLEGRWNVLEPVGASADAAQVSKLISTLGAIRVVNFLDDPNLNAPDDAMTNLSQPLASITSETDRRVVDADPSSPNSNVKIRTETNEVLIGKPADTNAQTRYARLGKNGPVVVISGAGLTRELFDPAQYVSKKAVQAQAGDVGMVVLERPNAAIEPPTTPDAPAQPALEPMGRVYRRDLDKWKEIAGATETALDDNMTKAMDELLKFLTTDDATSLSLGAPAVWREQGRLVIGSIEGTPLETIVVGGSDGPDLVMRTGEGKNVVYRSYQRGKTPRILTALLPKPTEAVPAPEGTKDVVK